ncbi:MAG: HD domain-containing protein [Candidatus Micrarchaeia archaeon]
MHVRDPIYHDIELDDTAIKIIEEPSMQRLRYIRQNGFSYLVYIGANHTRFEHSLGTMHATQELQEAIGDERQELALAGLLHDIGHGPFSHTSERIIKKYLKKDHEGIGKEIIKGTEISDIIANSTASLKGVLGYFDGKGGYEIVGGTIGSDRIDYLLRDSYYTGVAYGMIDYHRIKSKIASYKGKMAIHEQGVTASESLLIARYFMFKNVYMHHANIIADRMFEKAVEKAIESGKLSAKEFSRMDDESAMHFLLNDKSSSVIAARLHSRRLFKRAFYGEIYKSARINEDELSQEIMSEGVDYNDFVVAVACMKLPLENIHVIDKNGKSLGLLGDLSPLVDVLLSDKLNKCMLIVAAEPKLLKKVNLIVREYLTQKT